MCVLKQIFFHSGENILRDTNFLFKTHYILVADLPGWSWSWNTTVWTSFGSKYCLILLFSLGRRNRKPDKIFQLIFSGGMYYLGIFKTSCMTWKWSRFCRQFHFVLLCFSFFSPHFHCFPPFTCINTFFFVIITRLTASLVTSVVKWNV